MPYIGQRPATGEANSFKILDEISSFTLTFDGSSAGVVSVANDTITEREHRFVTGQRATYNDGGGTAITGLSDGVYYVIVEDRHTFKLASSANNAASGTAINLTGLGVGASHTLNVAFDGVNTKFKATHTNGTKAGISQSGQLMLSINGVIQEPHDNTDSPSTGYAADHTSTIIFSAAPASTDQFFGRLIASNAPTFDISDNVVDNFTGDGSTSTFTLSKTPPNNESVLVTIDGVVQYPDDTSAVRAYTVAENILSFISAPGLAVEIQVRHIGFAGASSAGITGFYGRTGNAVLKSTDNIVLNNATASGTVQAANVTVTGDLTVNGTTTTLDTDLIGVDKLEVAANNTTVAAAITQTGTGDILSLYDGSTKVFEVADGGNVFIGGNIPSESNIELNANGNIVATGNLTIADRIKHKSDTNTAIRFPSNDTVTVETAGSERVRITSDGKVGIGSAIPVTKLDVAGQAHFKNDGSSVKIESSPGTNFTQLQLTNTGGNFYVGRENSAGNWFGTGSNYASVLRSDGAYPLIFKVNGANRLRIDSAGTISASSATTTTPLVTLTNSSTAATHGEVLKLITGRGGNVADIGVISVHTNDGEIFRVQNDGNVGIGTDNPSDHLQILHTNGKGLTFKTTANHSAQITADCNRSAADNTILAIRGNWNGTGAAEIALTTGDDTTNKDDGKILFKTSPSSGNIVQRMEINRLGQLLINSGDNIFNSRNGFFNDNGGSSPAVQIEGSIYAYSSMSITRNGSGAGGPIFILAKGRGGTAIIEDDDVMGHLSFHGAEGGGDMVEGAKITAEVDGSPGSNNMPGRLVFYTNPGTSALTSSHERLRITSAGSVGIGLPNPDAKFQVNGNAVIGTDNVGLVEFTSTGVPHFAIEANANSYRSTRINVVNGGGWADLSFDAIDVAPKSGLPSAGSLAANIMYLDASTRNVGIGTTNPTFTAGGGVHLKGSGSDFTSYRVTTSSNTGVDFSQANDGKGYVYNRDNADLIFGTNDTERLRITADGDVSISSAGTVHGVSKLTILPANRTSAFSASDGDTWHDVVLMQGGGGANSAVGIAFELEPGGDYHKNAGTGIAAVKNGTAQDYGSDLVFITRPQSAVAQERLRITSGGTVLMGGQSAQSGGAFRNLELRNDSTTVGGSMTLVNDQSATAGATCQISCYQNYRSAGKIVFGRENANNWQAAAAGADSFLAFHTNDSGVEAERLRIDSGGRLITGNYSTALDTTAGSIIVNGETSGGRIAIRGSGSSANTTLSEMFGFWDTNKVAGFQFAGGSDTTNKDDGQIKFYTSASGPIVNERLRITSAGDVQVKTGNLVIGTSGKGIDFSAAGNAGGMTSELLDDYEEGTWSVTLAASGGSLAYTTSNTTGYYTKVGDVVNAWWYSSVLNITNNGIGYALVRGLPFNSTSAHQAYGVVSTAHNTAFSPAADGGYVAHNNSDILFQPTGSTSSANWLQANGRYLMIHAVYKAA